MSGEIPDRSEDISSRSAASNILRFQNFLKLDDISGVTINSIGSTNVMYVSSNTECTQFDVSLTLPVNLDVHMKISYPRIALFSKEIVDVNKLRIVIKNDEVRRELISCTNYLQRQRNANLALSILKKCAVLVAERQLVVEMLMLHCTGRITSEFHEDGGIVVTCKDNKTNFNYFESWWRIHFDCTNHYVMDFIDFSVTVKDPTFYATAKSAMSLLIQPNLQYKKKVELWSSIVQAANKSIQEDLPHMSMCSLRDFSTVRSNQEVNAPPCIKYEIVESDDEDCIVIEDE